MKMAKFCPNCENKLRHGYGRHHGPLSPSTLVCDACGYIIDLKTHRVLSKGFQKEDDPS